MIHFIRHGEGFHNVAGRIKHSNYQSYDYEDAHLTEIGWKQVRVSGHLTHWRLQLIALLTNS